VNNETLQDLRNWNPAKSAERDLVPTDKPGPLDAACRQMRTRGFPALHIEAIADGVFKPTDTQAAVWRATTEAIKRRGCVLIHGHRGVGKTQVAVGLGVQWHRYGLYANYGACWYWTAAGLIGAQIRWFSDKTGAEPIDIARDCGLLFLDEINELRTDTAFGQTELAALMDHRYSRGLPTVLLTNLSPDQTPKVLGWSIIDRIKDRGAVVALLGENIRDVIRKGGK
jgi:DNA replication protein DnaC